MPVRDCAVMAPKWLELGSGFADEVEAARFPKAELRFRNQDAAEQIGLDALDDQEWQAHFHRFEPLPGNLPQPLALRYHGHQFRSYNPELGDGRGFLFAQLRDLNDGRLLDLATKGSGTTPYSRRGDGRLTLKGGVREVLAAELLHALGVYTSRAFSLYETGEALQRGDEPSPTRSAVLVRLGHSHLRFGSFQYHHAHRDRTRVDRLVDYALAELHPDLEVGLEGPRAALLGAVMEASARLAASWMAAGFVHGVLNTDNMVVTGESFDYGPWRFLPRYDPSFVAAYFDHSGLYAYGQQPNAVHWNLARLAEALELSPHAVDPFPERFAHHFLLQFCRRLGLLPRAAEANGALVDATFALMRATGVDFDGFFHDWWGGEAASERALAGPRAAHYRGSAGLRFRTALTDFLPAAPEHLDRPYLQRAEPEGLVHEALEAVWAPIAEADDWGRFEAKLSGLRARRAATLVL